MPKSPALDCQFVIWDLLRDLRDLRECIRPETSASRQSGALAPLCLRGQLSFEFDWFRGLATEDVAHFQRHTAYVSANTGHPLLIVDRPGSGAPGTVRSSLTSRSTDELGISCEPAAKTLRVALDPSESVDLALATEAVLATGLLQALKRNFQSVGPLVVTAVDAVPLDSWCSSRQSAYRFQVSHPSKF
jgi:hypothetical protein